MYFLGAESHKCAAISIPKKKAPSGAFEALLARLLMHGLSPAPLAPLFELDLALHQLLVLGGPIVDALAFIAGELYQTVLRHNAKHYTPAEASAQLHWQEPPFIPESAQIFATYPCVCDKPPGLVEHCQAYSPEQSWLAASAGRRPLGLVPSVVELPPL